MKRQVSTDMIGVSRVLPFPVLYWQVVSFFLFRRRTILLPPTLTNSIIWNYASSSWEFLLSIFVDSLEGAHHFWEEKSTAYVEVLGRRWHVVLQDLNLHAYDPCSMDNDYYILRYNHRHLSKQPTLTNPTEPPSSRGLGDSCCTAVTH